MMTHQRRKALVESYRAREHHFPRDSKGRLNKAGRIEALSYIIGICEGMRIAGLPDDEIPVIVAFLAAVRGPEEAIEGQEKIVADAEMAMDREADLIAAASAISDIARNF